MSLQGFHSSNIFNLSRLRQLSFTAQGCELQTKRAYSRPSYLTPKGLGVVSSGIASEVEFRPGECSLNSHVNLSQESMYLEPFAEVDRLIFLRKLRRLNP